ncbi:hypothetical protein MMF93_20725 [Streptomyces tubbatahanensis]|uniref:Uncharacterized protein n=1 Tax=Streptomyces tubbatahanensis TaxID=2923272 RepID=A0ABY3XX15_9ACTN|nr:hypothetical protein [Streptomyces tubbatahanensis]UNS98613.1 hypothetical protein MMF93_20725 [Streptomyces tubbatahanensis]
MTGKDVEQTAEPESVPAWRAKLAAWGAVALVVLGALVGMWAYFRWEDTVPVPLLGPLAAKIVAVGLVFMGGALTGLIGTRTTATEDANDADDS